MGFLKKRTNRKLSYFIYLIYVTGAIASISVIGFFGYAAYNYFIFQKKIFTLKKIIILDRNMSRKEKNKIIRISGLSKGDNLVGINMKRVSRLIASDMWIKDVTVYKKYPDKIVIILKQRNIFAIIANNGSLYYINRDGYVLGRAGYEKGYGYPIITGLNADNADSYFDKLKKVLYFIKISKPSVISNLIGEINIERDGGITVYTDNGLYIKFGIDNYKNKLKTLKKLFYEINKIHIKYKNYINLEYKNEAVIEVNSGSRVLPAKYKNLFIRPDVYK